MKTVQSSLLIAALMLTAAAPLAAQQGRQGAVDRRQRSSLEILLDNRAELALTDDQVTKLTALNEKLAETNRIVAEEIRKVRGSYRPSNRQEAEQLRDAMRPLIEKIEENDRKALEEAEALLTDEQRQKARELVRKAREQMRPRVIRRTR